MDVMQLFAAQAAVALHNANLQMQIEQNDKIKGIINRSHDIPPLSSIRSVFISYGAPDQEFAEYIEKVLSEYGADTFIFSKHAVPGNKLHRIMREGVNKYDRVVLICSSKSLDRPGVLNEIEETLQREAREGGKTILIPITLDNYVFSSWAPTRPDIAQAIRDRVVADFRDARKKSAKFKKGISKLIEALRN